MNKRILAGALLALATAAANAQTFADGDVYVNTQNFGGAAVPVNTGTAAVLQNYSFAASGFVPANQINTGVFESAVATSEGALQYDPTSNSLWLAGYSTTGPNSTGGTATTTVTSTTAANDPRVAAQIFANGTVNKFTTPTDFSGNNIRSAVGINGAIVAAGTAASGSTATAGTRLYSSPSGGSLGPGVVESGATTNTRVASIYDGNVYYSTGSGTQGVFLGGSTPTLLAGINSPYQFRFSLDGLKTLYVASDDATAGGIAKYTLNGGAYTLAGTYKFNAAGNGLTTGTVGSRYFAVRPVLVNGVQQTTIVAATAFGTTDAANQLVSFVDDGNFAAPTFTVLATAGTNERYRGVEAVPEPASMAAIGIGLIGLAARRRKKSA